MTRLVDDVDTMAEGDLVVEMLRRASRDVEDEQIVLVMSKAST